MKILIVDQFSEPGGAQLCLRDLAPEIVRRGWDATFLAPGGGAIRDSLLECGIRSEYLAGFVSYSNGRKTLRDAVRYGLDIPRAIFNARRVLGEKSPDLVYINGPRVLPAGLLFRCPVVFHAHNRLVKNYARAIAAACVRVRHIEVIAASQFAAQALDGLVPAERMRVLYSGVTDMGFIAPIPGKFRIGIIGRIAPEKGHLELMRAAKLLLALGHKIEISIYGTSMFSSAGYEAHVRKEAVGISVRFAGWTQNVAAALHEIDILAVPSASLEAAGRVIMEAFSAGTPVVAYPSGGIPELICQGRTGLLAEQPTPVSLAQNIGRLLADPSLAFRLAGAARKEWESRFQLARYQREVCDLLDLIVSGSRTRGVIGAQRRSLSAYGTAQAD